MRQNGFPLRPLGKLIVNLDGRRVPVKESERRAGPYPYYGASGIVDYVDEYLFDGEHLLIAEDGENLRTRKTPVAFLATGKFWVNNHAHIVRGNDDAETRFLMYALQTADIRAYLTGSTMPKLTQANLNRIPVPAPKLEVQRRISSVLGSLDDKIALNRRMNETLEATARTLYSSLMEHKSTKTAGWKTVKAIEAFELVGGGTPKTSVAEFWDGDIPWFSVVDTPSGGDVWVLDTKRKITQAGLDSCAAAIIPEGTTIVTARGTVGQLALVGVPMAMNQSCYAVRGRKPLGPFLTYYSLRSLLGILKRRSHGSVFDTITRDTFRGIEVLVPPSGASAEFESRIRTLFEQMRLNLRQAEALLTTRDILLPKLISDEVA